MACPWGPPLSYKSFFGGEGNNNIQIYYICDVLWETSKWLGKCYCFKAMKDKKKLEAEFNNIAKWRDTILQLLRFTLGVNITLGQVGGGTVYGVCHQCVWEKGEKNIKRVTYKVNFFMCVLKWKVWKIFMSHCTSNTTTEKSKHVTKTVDEARLKMANMWKQRIYCEDFQINLCQTKHKIKNLRSKERIIELYLSNNRCQKSQISYHPDRNPSPRPSTTWDDQQYHSKMVPEWPEVSSLRIEREQTLVLYSEVQNKRWLTRI